MSSRAFWAASLMRRSVVVTEQCATSVFHSAPDQPFGLGSGALGFLCLGGGAGSSARRGVHISQRLPRRLGGESGGNRRELGRWRDEKGGKQQEMRPLSPTARHHTSFRF